jgi:hypothetical protein
VDGIDLFDVRPNDRLELADGSVVRAVAPGSPDGEHLPVEYVESRSGVFAAGERILVYAHEIVSWRPAAGPGGGRD